MLKNKIAFAKNILHSGLFILGGSLIVSGCSSDGEERPDYLNAQSVKSLEVPPKLTAPDTRGAMRLPKPSASAIQAAKTEIAPAFDGYRLKQEAGIYFLEIDSSVAEVWQMLPDFLRNEGIETERVEKLMGFVDTRWMDEYDITYGGKEGGSWFKSFSPDYKDKFRIRVEATNKPDVTRLTVAHRGVQVMVVDEGTQWVQRASEAYLEREILYRFMLFAGATQSAAAQLLADYRPYQSRVINSGKSDSTTTGAFKVAGEPAEVWKRLQVAVDRLGVDLLKADQAQSTLRVSVGNIKKLEKISQEEKSWFGRLFSGDVDIGEEYDDYEPSSYKPVNVKQKEKVVLLVTQLASAESSEIKVSHLDGKLVKSGVAVDFKNALMDALK